MSTTNVDGTRNVMHAASVHGVDRLVHTSTVGALGIRADGQPADETTPAALEDMVGHYERTKFLAERVADEWIARGLPVVIVNPSTSIGERDVRPTSTGRIVVDFLRGRTPAYVDTALNLVDVLDVAEGHILAADRGRIGEKYILGNRNMALKEILETLAALSGRAAPRVRLPHWIPYVYAVANTAWARVRGRAPGVPIDAVRMSRRKMVFDPGKAIRELGIPQRPVEAALERAATWFRANGYVD